MFPFSPSPGSVDAGGSAKDERKLQERVQWNSKTYHGSSCGNVISKEPTSLYLHVGIVDEALNLSGECGKVRATSIFKEKQFVLPQTLIEVP